MKLKLSKKEKDVILEAFKVGYVRYEYNNGSKNETIEFLCHMGYLEQVNLINGNKFVLSPGGLEVAEKLVENAQEKSVYVLVELCQHISADFTKIHGIHMTRESAEKERLDIFENHKISLEIKKYHTKP